MKSASGTAGLKNRAPSANKLLGLEVVRFVSAFAVLVWHYQHFSYLGADPVNFVRQSQPFYELFRLFYDYGHFGVEVFWCVSGYIFFWKYRDAIADRKVSGRSFLILRFSRLYPLHIATLLLVAALQLAYFHYTQLYFVFQHNGLGDFGQQLLLASAWVNPNNVGFNGPVWSISVEVLVYLLFFLGLRFVTRSWALNVVMLLLWPVSHFLHFQHRLIDCLYFFYVGGLGAMWRQSIHGAAWSSRLTAFAGIYVLALSLLAWSTHLGEKWLFSQSYLMTAVPALIFFCAHDFKALTRGQHVIAAAGNMTYSSYLIHFPIQLLIVMGFYMANAPIPAGSPWLFIAFFTVTLLLSRVTYVIFEAPAQRWIRARLAVGAREGQGMNGRLRTN
ncbi:MAG: acyltransferase [Proteobacteria bacterium]|nr:acyltransferase [Pseudomonadota bacterium]